MYEIPSGIAETYTGPEGEANLTERPPGTSPPCDLCPKGVDGGPDQDGLYTLSDETVQMLELYRCLQAPLYPVPAHLIGDALFADRYATTQMILREAEREADIERLAMMIVPTLR